MARLAQPSISQARCPKRLDPSQAEYKFWPMPSDHESMKEGFDIRVDGVAGCDSKTAVPPWTAGGTRPASRRESQGLAGRTRTANVQRWPARHKSDHPGPCARSARHD